MLWVIVGWAAAAVIALVVLGFCAYELLWKAKRLRQDLGRLQEVAGQLQQVAAELAGAQVRATAAVADAGRSSRK